MRTLTEILFIILGICTGFIAGYTYHKSQNTIEIKTVPIRMED